MALILEILIDDFKITRISKLKDLAPKESNTYRKNRKLKTIKL